MEIEIADGGDEPAEDEECPLWCPGDEKYSLYVSRGIFGETTPGRGILYSLLMPKEMESLIVFSILAVQKQVLGGTYPDDPVKEENRRIDRTLFVTVVLDTNLNGHASEKVGQAVLFIPSGLYHVVRQAEEGGPQAVLDTGEYRDFLWLLWHGVGHHLLGAEQAYATEAIMDEIDRFLVETYKRSKEEEAECAK